jgi:hypothetical protein
MAETETVNSLSTNSATGHPKWRGAKAGFMECNRTRAFAGEEKWAAHPTRKPIFPKQLCPSRLVHAAGRIIF